MDIVKCLKKNKIRFGKFIEEYLFSRDNIKIIILLIDIRHKPSENDKLMYEYIKSTNKDFFVIANKADKVAVTKVEERVKELKEELGMGKTEKIMPFSSERKIYTEDIWNNIMNWS